MTMCMVVKYVADGTSNPKRKLGSPFQYDGRTLMIPFPANDLRFNERGGGARTVVPAADLVSGAYYFITLALTHLMLTH